MNHRFHRRAIAGLLLFVPLLSSPLRAQPSAAKTPVVVAPVTEANINSAHRVVGTVNPLRTSTIGSAVGGRVLELHVDQGDAVEAGQSLAQLRTDTLELELGAAEAELALTKHQLAELENGSLPEDIAEAQALALGAKSAMDNSATALRRLQELIRSGAATASDLEDANERAAIAQYAFKAAEAARTRTERGPRPEQIAQAQARVDLQEQNILLIKDRIQKHTIVAPFDGFVAAKYTEVGAWINSGDPAIQVIQLDQVEVQAPVTAEVATKLKPGSTVRVEFPELPHKLWTGEVHRVVPVADSRARTFPVTIRLSNEIVRDMPLLMSGMLARVDLPAGAARRMTLVPKDALVLNGRERAVFILDSPASDSPASGPPKSALVRKVPVELGIAVGGMIQITGALTAGQFVVVFGNERLTPDSEVDVIDIRTADAGSASR